MKVGVVNEQSGGGGGVMKVGVVDEQSGGGGGGVMVKAGGGERDWGRGEKNGGNLPRVIHALFLPPFISLPHHFIPLSLFFSFSLFRSLFLYL